LHRDTRRSFEPEADFFVLFFVLFGRFEIINGLHMLVLENPLDFTGAIARQWPFQGLIDARRQRRENAQACGESLPPIGPHRQVLSRSGTHLWEFTVNGLPFSISP